MNQAVIILMLQTLACLLVVKGATNASLVQVNQNGCQNTNITLNCNDYLPGRSLKWYVNEESGTQIQIARIYKDGTTKVLDAKPELMKRLTLHNNGLLEISSLHPNDEALYECVVKRGPKLKTYRTQLSVSCGKVTKMERKVCVEEDVVLDCDAKYRSNPNKVKKISWKKETILENGSSYSLVGDKNGFRVHSNHSLMLPKGRKEGNDTYRCHVTKNDNKTKPDTHFIKAISVKCYKPAATVKTTQGRVAMTTVLPTKGTEVTMETTTSPSHDKVCGGVLNSLAGTFHSPNFPRAYPANSNCKWTISLPQGYSATNITLNHLNIEHDEDECQHDYIAIHDELGNQFGCRICGTRNFLRQTFQVKGRVAVVTFHSDSSVNKSGFKMTYKAARNAEKSVL